MTIPAQLQSTVEGVQVTISAEDMDIMQAWLTIQGDIASGTVTDIPAGPTRLFTVDVYKTGGIKSYSGSEYSHIFPNQTVEVEVTLSQLTGTAIITVVLPEGVPPPSITSIEPNEAPTNNSIDVTIQGANFRDGLIVMFGDEEVTLGSVSSEQIICYSPHHDEGTVDVVVTNPDGQEATAGGAFTFVKPPLEILDVIPNIGPASGGQTVEILGSSFEDGIVVRFGSEYATDVSFFSHENIACITPPGSPGFVTVTVTNPDGVEASRPGGFLYEEPGPVITGMEPQVGSQLGGTPVVITGESFHPSAIVEFGTQLAENVVVISGGEIQCETPPAPEPGPVDLFVRNPDGQEAHVPGAFEYLVPLEVFGLNPAGGLTYGGETITIDGQGFQPGMQVSFAEVPSTDVMYYSPNMITCTLPEYDQPGVVDVHVWSADGQKFTLYGGFTYFSPAPYISGITPNEGPVTGGIDVYVNGDGFHWSSTVDFGGIPAIVEYLSPSDLRCQLPPGSAPGPVNVTVASYLSAGPPAVLVDGFTYVALLWPFMP
jgi:hypothetical protein